MSQPTVVFASHSAQLDEAGISMLHTAAALQRYQVLVLLGEEGPLIDELARDGIRVEITPMSGRGSHLRSIARRLADIRPALVHTYSQRAGLVVGGAARVSRVPVVWQVDDFLRGVRSSFATRAAIRALAAVVIADSQRVRDTLPTGTPSCVAPSRVERIYDCVVAGHGRAARHVVVNGRFRTRPMSGVERFAHSVTALSGVPSVVRAPPRWVSRGLLGHLWEQLALPLRVSKQTILWSPCNFGPALVRRQIVTVHDLAPSDHPEWFSEAYRWWFNTLVPRLCKNAMAVTTVSSFTRDRLIEQFGVDPANVHLVPNGVSLRLPDATVAAEGEACSPYVLAVGSVDPRKNVDSVQRAISLVRRRRPSLGLIVAGTGSKGIFAASRIQAKGRDQFLGHVSDRKLATLYRNALCLVYPSFYEGFGLPPLEAMALGTRVVTSKLPPIEEVCGTVAAYVDPSSPTDIARGIELVLDETETDHQAAVKDGVARAGHYTWTRAADTFDRLVLDLWLSPAGDVLREDLEAAALNEPPR